MEKIKDISGSSSLPRTGALLNGNFLYKYRFSSTNREVCIFFQVVMGEVLRAFAESGGS